MVTTEAKVKKDLAKGKATITKHFNASPAEVWKAWTTQDVLEQWFAPKPWRAETESMDFREGGRWLYAMVGPNDERHYSKFEYSKITERKSFEGEDSFTNEKGEINADSPQLHWKVEFQPSENGTLVTTTVTSKTKGSLEKILDMGFEEGFKMGLNNLEEYLDRNSR
jgi:uncharacterized protein YndB with AHSA1/START domain